MNNDEQFENRLRRQPLRQVPSEWREEIVAQARVAADADQRKIAKLSAACEDRVALLMGWRLLFARLPLAWASLAALWVVLIGANLTLPSPFVSVTALGAPSAGLESLAALDLQQADFQSLANELMPAPDAAPASEQPAAPRRPRSERRQDSDTGEAHSTFLFDTIA